MNADVISQEIDQNENWFGDDDDEYYGEHEKNIKKMLMTLGNNFLYG